MDEGEARRLHAVAPPRPSRSVRDGGFVRMAGADAGGLLNVVVALVLYALSLCAGLAAIGRRRLPPLAVPASRAVPSRRTNRWPTKPLARASRRRAAARLRSATRRTTWSGRRVAARRRT
ncbi:MAG: hypothetical protein ACKOYG_09050 [Ilumatobacteraceae bacterium]